MFRYFQRKWNQKKERGLEQAPRRRLPLLAEIPEQILVKTIQELLSNQHVSVSALFLVAFENFKIHFNIFCSEKDQRRYPPSLEGWIEFMADCHAKCDTESAIDEISKRRFFYFYLSGLMIEARLLVDRKPEFLDQYIDIWIQLLEGGRALRATLDRTSLWSSDYTTFFDLIPNEDEGERYVKSIMPQNLRYHRKIIEWEERDLTPAQREELARMENEFNRYWQDKT